MSSQTTSESSSTKQATQHDEANGKEQALHRRIQHALYKRLLNYELSILLIIAAVLGAILLFVNLAGEVLEGDTQAFDEAILLAMRTPGNLADPLGPLWLEEMLRDFTALGGVGVSVLLAVTLSLYFAVQRRYTLMWFVIFVIGGGNIISVLLKTLFDRPRPSLVPHESYVYTASFPSGHTMTAAMTYLALGVLLMRLQPTRRLKAVVMTVMVLITVLVGCSRVYLGVHWPTDVLGGWTVGAIWAALSLLVLYWVEDR